MGEDTYYSLDEFAQMMAMTPRNVRAYATRGLIDRPIRAGRRAVYTPAHRAQLEWVLQQFAKERLPLHVIRRLIERGQRPPLDDTIGTMETIGIDVADEGTTSTALPDLGEVMTRSQPDAAAGQTGPGHIPAVRQNSDDGAMAAPSPRPAYLEPGDPPMPVSLWVDLRDYEPRVFRLMAAVQHLAESLGYVHFSDTHRQIDPVWRLSLWHRSLPSGEARSRAEAIYASLRGGPANRAAASADPAARAVEDVVDLAKELDGVAVWVGPVVVVGQTTRSGEAMVIARGVGPTLLRTLAESPREAARPRSLLDHLAAGSTRTAESTQTAESTRSERPSSSPGSMPPGEGAAIDLPGPTR